MICTINTVVSQSYDEVQVYRSSDAIRLLGRKIAPKQINLQDYRAVHF
ncbi:hypothetical protein VCRA2128O102_210043 [Vibrio crassostreae]|nr:hypothetical protein VCRA2128O106_210044 [Vibrio crassostreae]CAK2775541.1 hypothetical protein VCRA2126O84_240043 [Vibrio crassostreae]CAK3253492.1 hypothetical protein VCRA2128O102_210043 [Vibrio crassostreae]CAK3284035.1 hypothetical protein VCRA2128O105_210044 [Vibrio crassostreae]CAK3412583.1 hypothetical protein VCRA2128O109_230041 [Vibrio crassostreae]